MHPGKFPWAAIFLLMFIATPAGAAISVADGDWNQGTTWDGGTPPSQASNGGNGEEVRINSHINVPSGVDYVGTSTIDVNGDPAGGINTWLVFDSAAALGSALTIQDGARVGSKYQTQVLGGASATVDILSGGEYVTAGIDNAGGTTFTINVEAGGVLTFDSSIHPHYPTLGFQRGNIYAEADTGSANIYNIRGLLNHVWMDNSNVENNYYNLIDGGVINAVPLPGQAIGLNSGNPVPFGGVRYEDIYPSGTGGTVTNAFGGSSITSVPAGLTVDISDQTVFDTDISTAWSDWVTANGGDPTMQAGPRRGRLSPASGATFTGTGTIQLDFYGFDIDDSGTPTDTSDDALVGNFHDDLYDGPGADPSNSTFAGEFALGYVGGALTDNEVEFLNDSDPEILLINGATNNSYFDNLGGLAIPDQVWSDGVRQYDVTFSNIFFHDLGDPFPPGTPDGRLVFTSIDSITVKAGLDGDFDHDGDVDGKDFLVWQRGNSPNGINSGDLALWQGNYSPSLNETLGSVVGVPEPTTLSSLGILLIMLAYRRRVGRDC